MVVSRIVKCSFYRLDVQKRTFFKLKYVVMFLKNTELNIGKLVKLFSEQLSERKKAEDYLWQGVY